MDNRTPLLLVKKALSRTKYSITNDTIASFTTAAYLPNTISLLNAQQGDIRMSRENAHRRRP